MERWPSQKPGFPRNPANERCNGEAPGALMSARKHTCRGGHMVTLVVLMTGGADGRPIGRRTHLSMITGSEGVSLRFPQLFLSQQRLRKGGGREEARVASASGAAHLHITSCVSSTRHISGFLSCPSYTMACGGGKARPSVTQTRRPSFARASR